MAKTVRFLSQGTLYPDVIESGPSPAGGRSHQVGITIRRPAERMHYELVERCANCLRTRCARSAASSGCLARRAAPFPAWARDPLSGRYHAEKLDICSRRTRSYRRIRRAGL